jgi:membrane protein DedA with SNARE-associated domain
LIDLEFFGIVMFFMLGYTLTTFVAQVDLSLTVQQPIGGWMQVIIGLQIVLATHLSEDLACISAGILAGQNYIPVYLAFIACTVGILVADSLLYFIGRWAGRPALQKWPLGWWIKPKAGDKAAHWFETRGSFVVILSRFLPGSRVPVFVSAGILAMPFAKFFWLIFFSSLVWTPVRIGLAMLLGELILVWFDVYQNYALLISLIAILLLWFGLRQIQRLVHY